MDLNTNADTVIVLDFETSGLSPDCGDRAIEIGAVKLVDGVLVDRFQKLMNPHRRIDSFIEQYTGITNKMLSKSAPCDEVMHEFSDYIGNYNLVAHNASFDSRFLDAELSRIKRNQFGSFACSMLISRRIYPDAPNHKLGTLVEYKNLPNDGVFHRALADAEMTAYLWLEIIGDIKSEFSYENISFDIMKKLSRTSRKNTDDFLRKMSDS